VRELLNQIKQNHTKAFPVVWSFVDIWSTVSAAVLGAPT